MLRRAVVPVNVTAVEGHGPLSVDNREVWWSPA